MHCTPYLEELLFKAQALALPHRWLCLPHIVQQTGKRFSSRQVQGHGSELKPKLPVLDSSVPYFNESLIHQHFLCLTEFTFSSFPLFLASSFYFPKRKTIKPSIAPLGAPSGIEQLSTPHAFCWLFLPYFSPSTFSHRLRGITLKMPPMPPLQP